MSDPASEMEAWVPRARTRRSLVREVADELVEQIAARRWLPGDRLPPLQALAEALGVSRASVREAIRRLQAQGLVRIEHGRGVFVREAEPVLLLPERILEVIVRSPEKAKEVQEARLVLELGLTELAVRRATARDVDLLRETLEASRALVTGAREPDRGVLFELGLEFHLRLARAAHSGLLESLYGLLAEPLRQTVRQAHGVKGEPREDLRFHLAVVEAIERRDVARALDAMRTHVERTTAIVLAEPPPT